MKVSQFNRVLYKGNINVDFYLFCLRRDFKLIKYLFINLWYFVCSYLFFSKKDILKIRKFRYLKDVKNINKVVSEFYEEIEFVNYFDLEFDVIVDKVPRLFMRNQFKGIKKICYDLDENFDVKLDKFDNDVLKIKKASRGYFFDKSFKNKIDFEKFYVVKNKKMVCLRKKKKVNEMVWSLVSLIVLSCLITIFSFMFTGSYLNMEMFWSYFEIRLFLLNLLPVLIVMLVIFFSSRRLHVAWLVSSLMVLIWGIANQTKVFYRDDIVKFEDLSLIKEAVIMAGECDLVIKSYTVVLAILSILIFFILKRHIKKIDLGIVKRLVIVIILLLGMFFGYKGIYKNTVIYDSVGDLSLINKWIFTRQSQVRGLIYPFVYTLDEGNLMKPDNYSEKEVEDILNGYCYQDIEKSKKVNVIAIMLESYNDFSKFDEIDFNEDIYKYLHEIQKKSVSGTLITNIFGGGTVNTERNFLTGYNELSGFRKKTNSYVWYFKEQGYRTEAMHPIYGAFYNRASINPNLGFDIYYNFENKYSKIQDDFVSDDIFFDSIIEGYLNSVKDGVPYFNFSVTYQNHVPYNDQSYEGKKYYFDNDGMNEGLYNQINEYFYGIERTNKALRNLINYFDKENEPVVIIFFGDHNPGLGDNALGYNELGIDIDLSTVDGFLNYYQTPYVIHANDSAKEVLNNDIRGVGSDISPIFLMNELFDNLGFDGNEYLQYMNDLKKKIDVINPSYYKENGDFVESSNSKYKSLVEEYNAVNYYLVSKKMD